MTLCDSLHILASESGFPPIPLHTLFTRAPLHTPRTTRHTPTIFICSLPTLAFSFLLCTTNTSTILPCYSSTTAAAVGGCCTSWGAPAATAPPVATILVLLFGVRPVLAARQGWHRDVMDCVDRERGVGVCAVVRGGCLGIVGLCLAHGDEPSGELAVQFLFAAVFFVGGGRREVKQNNLWTERGEGERM